MSQIFLKQQVPLSAYKPRAYLNGFPKAGLHMLEQLVGVLLTGSDVGNEGACWLGTYKFNSWTMQWQDMRRVLWRMSCQLRGTYLMGHSGYNEDFRTLMRYGNIGHIFLYRDLRDVAVSQAHHIMDEGRTEWSHPHKEIYQMLGSFDKALSAVIEGVGPYPGVVERWAEYAPWLDCEEILVLTYEEMRSATPRTAGKIILFLMKKATELLDDLNGEIQMDANDLRTLAGQMADATKTKSTTSRKGVVGGWKEEFKPEHVELFKKCDPDNWLMKLGFETDPDWGVTDDRTDEGRSKRRTIHDGGQRQRRGYRSGRHVLGVREKRGGSVRCRRWHKV